MTVQVVVPLLLAVLAGCHADPAAELSYAVAAGRYGDVRVFMKDHQRRDRRDRRYLYDRMHLGVSTLVDGFAGSGAETFNEIFDVLRTQGINADKTVASVVINEDLKFWKGEPFEQAMAFLYVAYHHAMLGDWANVRAATDNSLFYLRDFGADVSGRRPDGQALVRQAMDDDQALTHYTARPSNFSLGYLMSAIANQQLHRDTEAAEQFAKVLCDRPHLEDLVKLLRSGEYNTVFVVDYGSGPRKVGTGPDRAIAQFETVVPSDDAPLLVTIAGATQRFAAAADLNVLARDHMWNNLEDIRVAKSYLGSILLGVGAATVSGDRFNDGSETWLGLGLVLGGTTAKAGAHADTRHCQLLPQRVYVAAVHLTDEKQPITMQVESVAGSKLRLAGLSPPSGPTAQMRYVRLRSQIPQAPSWATSGQIYYANDRHPDAVDEPLPFILGGRCVRKPTPAALAAYHQAGYLMDLSLVDLQALYRAEGIRWDDDAGGAQPELHVLEGGVSLAVPLSGTTGYARLFGQDHPPYRPKSQWVRQVANQQRSKTAAGQP